MGRATLFIASLIIGTNAVQYGPDDQWTQPTFPYLEPSAHDVLEIAALNPTMTRSVSFKPFERYWDSLAEDSVLRGAEWTWRINVSDTAVPDAEGELYEAVDPHVVSTTYDFAWPAKGNISDALDGATGPFCIRAATNAVDLPVNLTNGYTEEDGNSASCAPILGQQCVDAILALIPKPTGEDCHFFESKPFDELPECQDSLGAALPSFQEFFFGTPLIRNITAAGNDTKEKGFTEEWNHGSAFYTNISATQNGSDSRAYHYAANRVHMFLMSAELPTNPDAPPTAILPTTGGPELLCMRVNATKLPNVDVDGDGVAYTYETVLESGSYGIYMRHDVFDWVWVAALPTIVVFLVGF